MNFTYSVNCDEYSLKTRSAIYAGKTIMVDKLEQKFLLEVSKRKREKRLFKKLWRKIKLSFTRIDFKQFNFNRINYKRVQVRHMIGIALLLFLIFCQRNLGANPINRLITKLAYNPTPPVLESPWSWSDKELHPLIAKMTPETEKSIKSVADYIAKNESDPYLRIKAIHDYVINRVEYDLDVLTTGNRPKQDAQTVFKTHEAVCEGYAKLFQALAKAMGAEVAYVRGRVREEFAPVDLIPFYLRAGTSKHDWTLHAWNAVKIDGSWQLVDTTWDDNKQNKYSADYLMLPPQAMIVSHFPHLAAWQLLAQPRNRKSFENSPILQPQFFAQGLTLITPQKYETEADTKVLIKIKTPKDYRQKVIAMSTPSKQNKLFNWQIFQQKSSSSQSDRDIFECQTKTADRNIEITCDLPKSGQHKVLIYSQSGISTFLGEFKFN
ncbi:MAG: transglutaminase domain-containing protein [Cyanobacteria bacterium J06555_3]